MAYIAPRLPIDRLGPRRGLLLAALLICAIAATDYASGYEMRLSILYLPPIALAAWTAGTASGIGAAVLASLLWLLSFKTGHFYKEEGFYFWEAAVLLCGFLVFAWLSARLRAALAQADERFTRVLEEMRAAVHVVDMGRDTILYANPEMLRVVGTADELAPPAFAQRFAPVTESGSMPASATDRGFASGTVRDRRSGRWYLLQDGSLPWGTNPHIRLRVLTDITERKNAELLRAKHIEVMHQAAQLTTLAEMSSTLAHEINQPLMAIATYTDACRRLLAAPGCDHAEISRALERCHAQAVRAAAILERLREFIRQRRHRPAACDAQAVVSEALDIVRPLLDETGVAVAAPAPAAPLPIVADRILLVQVLVNLIRNAVEAMHETAPERRRLAVAATADAAGEIAFSVADSGPGIDPAAVETLFAPFHTTKADGLGLGLAICRSVAEAHGGQLAVAATPGGGATFLLTLPAAPDLP